MLAGIVSQEGWKVMIEKIEKLRRLIEGSRNIVFFGGAGVSTESGIPDFRSESGLYYAKEHYGYSPEQMLSHSFFMTKTEEFYGYYRENIIHREARPNAAHRGLAQMESQGKLEGIVTQNIDGLHQMAGSQKVLELHGSIHRNRCTLCEEFHDLDYVDGYPERIPLCRICGGVIKPEVVLYEEALDDLVMEASIRMIREAELLIIGGTSLVVYPAAGLLRYFSGKELVLINKTSTSFDSGASLIINEKIGQVFSVLNS